MMIMFTKTTSGIDRMSEMTPKFRRTKTDIKQMCIGSHLKKKKKGITDHIGLTELISMTALRHAICNSNELTLSLQMGWEHHVCFLSPWALVSRNI